MSSTCRSRLLYALNHLNPVPSSISVVGLIQFSLAVLILNNDANPSFRITCSPYSIIELSVVVSVTSVSRKSQWAFHQESISTRTREAAFRMTSNVPATFTIIGRCPHGTSNGAQLLNFSTVDVVWLSNHNMNYVSLPLCWSFDVAMCF